MTQQKLTVWDKVPARPAQAAESASVFDSITGALGKNAEQGVQAAVKDYLNGKGDARIAALLNRLNLVASLVGISLTLYLLNKSDKSK